MPHILQIDGDPSRWVVREPFDPQQLTGDSPVSVQVTSPLVGTLLVSPKAASVVSYEPGQVGWEPGHIQLPAAVLYLPSPAGPTASGQGYPLPEGTNLTELADAIMAAMTRDTVLTVPVSGSMDGVAVLKGARLSFAVICPATVAGPATASGAARPGAT